MPSFFLVQLVRWYRPGVVGWVVFALGVVLGAIGVAAIESHRIDVERQRTQELARDYAQTTRNHIDRALSATYALAALVQQGRGEVQDFEDVAARMLPNYPGASLLILAPGGVIRSIVPEPGNEKALGLNLLEDPVMRAEARRAHSSGKLTLAGPLPLRQGGIGLVARLPVFLATPPDKHSTFWGFANVVMRLPESIKTIGLDALEQRGMHYLLWRQQPESDQRQTILGSTTLPLHDPVCTEIAVPNGAWNLCLAPQSGWRQPQGLARNAVLATLLAALLGYLARLQAQLFWSHRELERQVQQRTADIAASKAQLSATLDAVADLMFELDLDGLCHACHAPAQNPLARYASRLLGRYVRDTLPPDAAEIVLGALAEAHANGLSMGRQIFVQRAPQSQWFELSVARKRLDPEPAKPRFIVVAHDVTEHRLAQDNVASLAYFDVLTALPNRSLLNERIARTLTEAGRRKEHLCLMFLDLDHFKYINDTLGHSVGDQFLVLLARRMQQTVREQDTVARLGGDEFILLLPNTDGRGAARVAEKLLQAVSQPAAVGAHELCITPSIGIAVYPEDGHDADTLLQHADIAMYRAKGTGRNGFRFFTNEMQSAAARTLLLDNELRRALAREQFGVVYQPQVCLATGRIIGFEALLRWTHPELGRVSPLEFIPVAESNGLILPIGEWVLRTAVTQARDWAAMGFAELTMAVNLSAIQFRQPHLNALINIILLKAGLPADLLKLELTESVAHQDPLAAVRIMDKLHQRGIHLSIDDFGTGYSSLSYLKRFAVHQIKIDQSFVRDITHDADDLAIVRAIINMARSLDLTTVAEGVETAEQLALLRQEGCNEVQGYCISQPLSAELATAFLQKHWERGALPVGEPT
ncbi:bifunctional diguanylate cyclase/phosphodiesterase [Candidatus Symbiobacter mobilis]|uniref:Signal transduction protein n=1 Tax=Candidatus Symbiobacter mobilis CR TaxID=946483 RepID=U5NBL1_9BURK|nr:EAL domain-containing protein [Candidatus Symbiobacter mobilis]AGX87628.1 signal transduction protein [Candidatus Symbiobacter mobilis CR]